MSDPLNILRCGTGSVDRTVKIWDLALGVPVASSPLHRDTVRAVAIDIASLVSGSSDEIVRVWDASYPDDDLSQGDAASGDNAQSRHRGPPRGRQSEQAAPVFDLRRPRLLRGHTGPVATLDLSTRCVAPFLNANYTSRYLAYWNCKRPCGYGIVCSSITLLVLLGLSTKCAPACTPHGTILPSRYPCTLGINSFDVQAHLFRELGLDCSPLEP